jgi:hypothetical protein
MTQSDDHPRPPRKRGRKPKPITEPPAPKREVGRPRREWAPHELKFITSLARIGLTKEKAAEALGFSLRTFIYHEHVTYEFRAAWAAGKLESDGKVINALYKRAVGYRRKSEKLFCTKDGDVIRAEIVEHVEPDIGAAQFWLSHRHPEQWGKQGGSAGTPATQQTVQITAYIDADTMTLATGKAPALTAEESDE